MRSNFKQDRDYNCGIFASMYVLWNFCGIRKLNPRFLEELAWTKKRDGTRHEGICEIFRHYQIDTEYGTGTIDLIRGKVPVIVNFQLDRSGHYGVIIGWNGSEVHLWEPWGAKSYWLRGSDFDKIWFSKRFGSHWFLHPFNTKAALT
jgi:ABC-type bacteriocin/lantibiotic exporter with double-glycine peptidase domain